MTQDYKARSAPAPRSAARRRRGRSCFWWFLLGVMLGSFGVGMAWMLQSPPPPGPPDTGSKADPPQSQPMEFTFHNILPDTRVDVPREEPARPTPLPPPRQTEQTSIAPPSAPRPQVTAAPPSAGAGSYMLQIGSFRRSTDADSQKAKLALLGIQARISTAQVNGVTYHRVVSGPYPGKQAAERAKALLSRNGLDSFATKVK